MIRRPPRSTLFPLHDALPILYGLCRDDGRASTTLLAKRAASRHRAERIMGGAWSPRSLDASRAALLSNLARSEEHTSELQSRQYLVCRLLLEKKKQKIKIMNF